MPIEFFRALYLGDAPMILPQTQYVRRRDIVNRFSAADVAGDNAARDLAVHDLTGFSNEFVVPVNPTQTETVDNFNRWFVGVQEALAALIVPTPDTPGATMDNTLYIVTMPEFSLNCWCEPGGVTTYNALGVLPETLETYMAIRIRDFLRATYPNRRVIFAIECCIFRPVVVVEDARQKLSCAARLTIISSNPAVDNVYIHKRVRAAADQWSVRLYADMYASPDNAQRIIDTRYILNFPGDPPNTSSLSFGVCRDVESDDHGPRNLCVYVGSGLPVYTLQDVSHPFILNDHEAWSGGSNRLMKPPGYYTFIRPKATAPPAGSGLSKDDRLDNMVERSYLALPRNGAQNLALLKKTLETTTAFKVENWKLCWYHRSTTSPAQDNDPLLYNGVVACRVGAPIPFPGVSQDFVPRQKASCLPIPCK